MKTLTVTSPQYRPLTDYFLRSVVHEADNTLIVAINRDASAKPPNYGSTEFNRICRDKLVAIIETLKKMGTGEVLLYCDPDVILIEKPSWFEKHLIESKKDIMTQYDQGDGHCMGFVVMRATVKVIELLNATLVGVAGSVHDQESFNRQVRTTRVKVGLFSTEDVASFGTVADIPGTMWTGQRFELPPSLKAFHANFTIGLDSKLALIEYAWSQRFNN